MKKTTRALALTIALLLARAATAVETNQADASAGFEQRIAELKRRADALPEGGNAYVRLGDAVARRFIHFVQTGQMSPDWTRLQLEEVAQVLDETEKIARRNPPELNWTPPSGGWGKDKYRNGTFTRRGQPCFFYGYGHFNSVIDDLPNFPALGASLIQDGRAGPSSMSADGKLGEGALDVVHGLDRAALYGMGVDFLLSPHYYPDWAQAPDVPNGNIGFIKFNIFHPKAMDAIGRWAEKMGAAIRDKPALHSVCLANEPVYNSSGRDAYTRPIFSRYLRVRHHTIEDLNALYGTAYASFDSVAVPPAAMPDGTGPKRAYYDWTCFNKKMFAAWHDWMGSVLKTNGVEAPMHTKIMVFQTLDRDKVGWGVDPELMCGATDLAGCDAYAFPTGGAYAYDWLGHEFFYDLLHSFRGQSVFNSENHLIPDNSPPTHIPMNHSRSVICQDGLHHEGSTTIWVWQMGTDDGLGGSIYFRPANVFGAGRAMLDLNRLAPEVTAINNAKPRVALLYSQPSIFWDDKYKGTIMGLYADLSFLGQPVTFISERQLAEGRAAKVDWLIVPNATHVFDTTPAALEKFARHGRQVLLFGKDCLSRDEYDRPLAQPQVYPIVVQPPDGDLPTATLLRHVLRPIDFTELREARGGKPAWGIEFRTVPYDGSILVPMVNFNKDARTVAFPQWAKRQVIDILNGEFVNANSILLEPMSPRLLRFER